MAKKSGRTLKKVFIETSVFIRFLTNDDPKKAGECHTLLERVESGAIRPYLSNIVVLEVVYVLHKLYRFPRVEVQRAINMLLELRNVTLIEKTDTRQALLYFRAGKAKYGDCLIVSQLPRGMPLITYDADFQTLPEIQAMTPAQFIAHRSVSTPVEQ